MNEDVLGQRYAIAENGEGFVVFSRSVREGSSGLIIKWDDNEDPNFIRIDSFLSWIREGIVKRVT